ncbi:MAG TPA: preprotein translocase subunit SecG, partial [Epsilonproteobacteria bacterium]|nr:preprotein translocase subunit SecG [Campylobacterota bacterium]
MTSTLLIVQIVLAIAITISVLLQKSSSIGLGAYSGSNESMFGAKGPMGFLAKLTFTLGLFFILNTLVLGYLYTKENSKTVADTITSSVPVSPETKKAAAPTAPSAPGTGSTQPAAGEPAAPSAPAAVNTESNSTIPKP